MPSLDFFDQLQPALGHFLGVCQKVICSNLRAGALGAFGDGVQHGVTLAGPILRPDGERLAVCILGGLLANFGDLFRHGAQGGFVGIEASAVEVGIVSENGK